MVIASLAILAAMGLIALAVVRGAKVIETPDQARGGIRPVTDPFELTRSPQSSEGYTYSPAIRRPTAGTAQSKLWFADGTWWGLLLNPGDDRVHIYELTETSLWRDTGTVVDARVGSRGDALWVESTQELVVATRTRRSPVQVTRFAYDSGSRRWKLDDGFPQAVETGGRGPESVSVARDSTGRLWVTYTEAGTVRVAHSDPDGLSWTPGFQPPGADTSVSADDISGLVSFDSDGSRRGSDSIGVLWSDQDSDAFRFAFHRDGAPDSEWRVETALAGPDLADDHLSLKTVRGPAGDLVMAAVKTSKDASDGPDATLVGVLVRTPPEVSDAAGQWSMVPAGTVADGHSRPLLLVDAATRELLVLATARPKGSDVYLKRAPLADLRFPDGRGEPFLVHDTPVQDVSGTKQQLTGASGVLALAHSRGQHRYVYTEAALTPEPVRP